MNAKLMMGLSFIFTNTVFAESKNIQDILQKQYPNLQIKQITDAPIKDWKQIEFTEGAVGYVDRDANFLLLGALVDLKKRQLLSPKSNEMPIKTNTTNSIPPYALATQQPPIMFNQLPLQAAIKRVNGNGQAKLVVFSDPECPYCQQLERVLEELKDTTVYIFPYPLPIHAGAYQKSSDILCAKNPSDDWKRIMTTQATIGTSGKNCNAKVDAILKLGESLKIFSTPTLFNSKGERLTGYQSDAVAIARWIKT